MIPSSTKLRFYRAGQLTLGFAAAALIASACATVVEEDPGLTSGATDSADAAGPLTSSTETAGSASGSGSGGPGNTTTVSSGASNTSGGNGNGAANNANNNTTSSTSGGANNGGPLGAAAATAAAANAASTGNSTTASATTGSATTGSATTGAPFGGNGGNNNTTGGAATTAGAGGNGSTGAPFGGFGDSGEAAATTSGANCEADPWESGKTTTDSNGNAYSEGDLIEYMGVVYSVDQDQNYGHPMCPPDGSGEDWCATQYSFTPVPDC